MAQKLFIGKLGEIVSLRVKDGSGIQLQDVAPMSVNRVSEIEWDCSSQKWNIKILSSGNYRGIVCGDTLLIAGFKDAKAVDNHVPVAFDTYEEAVDFEIRLIQHIRSREGMYAI